MITITGDEVKVNGKNRIEFSLTASQKIKKKVAEKLKLKKEGKIYTRTMPKDPAKMLIVAKNFNKQGLQLLVNPLVTLDMIPVTEKAIVKKFKALRKQMREEEEAVVAEQTKLDATKAEFTDFVKNQGTMTKPGTEDAVLIIGTEKWQYTFTKGRTSIQEKEVIAWGKDKKNSKIAKALVVKKEIMDKKVYENLKKAGRISVKDLEKFEVEGNPSYRLNFYDLADKLCPKCKEKITTRAKFCKACGHKLK